MTDTIKSIPDYPLHRIKPLYRKNGYLYRLIYRANLVAMYTQISDTRIIAYEVCEIIWEPESIRFGKVFEAHERLPGTNDWGTRAFTCSTIEAAYKRVLFLQGKIRNRK